jgi:hypothetical protein
MLGDTVRGHYPDTLGLFQRLVNVSLERLLEVLRYLYYHIIIQHKLIDLENTGCDVTPKQVVATTGCSS